MKIPKIISYCWFGGNPLPESAKKCIASWKEKCPDYEIKEWNETNYDVNKIPYIRDAYKEKKWAFVSDYARLDIIYTIGGIYLDTDVELVKSLDELVNNESFWAIEKSSNVIATGLGFGAQARNEHIKKLLQIYNRTSFYTEDGSLNLVPCTAYATEYFEKQGFVKKDKRQEIQGAVILSSEVFCPMNFYDGSMNITSETIGIHWYDMSWFGDSDKKIHMVENGIKRKLPKNVAKVLCFVYRKGYRLIEYTQNGTLIENIARKRKNKT